MRNGKDDAGDDTPDTEEDHFILDIFNDACLLGDMEMIDERLQTLFRPRNFGNH